MSRWLPAILQMKHKTHTTKNTTALKIVVVVPDLDVQDPNDEHAISQAERSRALRIGLLESGFNLMASLPADVFLADRIHQLQPDLIIVDAESEARDALEHVVFATRDARRPIVLFTDDNDTTHVRAAIAAGVTAYVVAGLAPERAELRRHRRRSRPSSRRPGSSGASAKARS